MHAMYKIQIPEDCCLSFTCQSKGELFGVTCRLVMMMLVVVVFVGDGVDASLTDGSRLGH
jgi:hypothetical protein